MEILNVNETASFNFLTQSLKRKAKSHSVKFKVLNFKLWFYALRFTLFAILVSLCFLNCPAAQAAEEPVNYKSGISVLFGGTRGVDWEEEVFWYKPEQDDSKVVYIRSTTSVIMQHNILNEMQTKGGEHIVIRDDGGGKIRYCVDRDYQRHYYWAKPKDEVSARYPEYTWPFSFSQLAYGTGYSDDDSNIPIVGTTGHNNKGVIIDSGSGQILVTDRYNHYQYGQLDKFGDEWHQMAVADDDTIIRENAPPPGPYTFNENHASDSKLILFVVNPKTPCIRFFAEGSGEFYTTPPKVFQVPKIHEQITYVTDDVLFSLSNISDTRQCYYKWDNQVNYTEYTARVSCNPLVDGRHILYYYYDPAVIKSRVIIKNPDFPSAKESHGYMLWENDQKFQKIKLLCTQFSETVNYRKYNESFRNRLDYPECFNTWNKNFPDSPYIGKGTRKKWSKTFNNAFVAKVEGFNSTLGAEAANRAKGMLLDNAITVANLGLIIANGEPNPGIVIWRRGYYDDDLYLDQLAAYDILIKDYKSTDVLGGITPVEDYKIRDTIAYAGLIGMMVRGDYPFYAQVNNRSGMWGTCRELAAFTIGTVMPSYSTPYYGTSGFNGTKAEYCFTPYPNQAFTWKEVFFLEKTADGSSLPMLGFPNLAHPFGLHEQFTTETVIRSDGQELPPGSFTDRVGYATIDMMGHGFQQFANNIKISPYTKGKTYPYLEMFFQHCNSGTVYGLKSTGTEAGSIYAENLLLINDRFLNLASAAAASMDLLITLNNKTLDTYIYQQGIWGLIFYDPYWQVYSSAYDAALAARIAVGLDAYPTGDNLTKADVSGDGFVTAYDAALIAQKAVGLISKFPVES